MAGGAGAERCRPRRGLMGRGATESGHPVAYAMRARYSALVMRARLCGCRQEANRGEVGKGRGMIEQVVKCSAGWEGEAAEFVRSLLIRTGG